MPSGQWINVSPNVDTSLGAAQGHQPADAVLAVEPARVARGLPVRDGDHRRRHALEEAEPGSCVPKGRRRPPRRLERRQHRAQQPEPAEQARGAAVQPAGARGAAAGLAAGAPGAQAGAPGGRGAAAGGSIESMSASTVAPGVIWVGTNNGLIKVTRNHGVTWDDATIPDLPNPTRADISAIDASHHDPATAYVAIDYHTTGDYKPYLYRTRDYGKTWTTIVNGLATDQPSGSFARVIRADTKKAGLLFAGTESSVYVSFDDGDTWQSLMLNLPNTSYRDSRFKDNDLVAGHLRPRLLDARRHLAAQADHAGHGIGAGAPVQAGRRHAGAAQRQRRHAVPTGGSARAESAARRDHLLLPRREAGRDDHARHRGRRGPCRPPPVERTDPAAAGSAAGGAGLLAGKAEADADRGGHQPDQLEHPVRQSAGLHAQLRPGDGRDGRRHARVTRRPAGAARASTRSSSRSTARRTRSRSP